jgi:hypothetical protein
MVTISRRSGPGSRGGHVSQFSIDGVPVLLFILLAVGQLVVYYYRRRQPPRSRGTPPAPGEPTSAGAPTDVTRRDTVPDEAPAASAPPAPARHTRKHAPARPHAAGGAPDPSRGSRRRELLGSTRRVRDGVVVAAILGRCRAMDPYKPD